MTEYVQDMEVIIVSEIDLLIQELRDTIDNQREEIDRLNNIISELEKWLIDKQDLTCGCGITVDYLYAYENCLDKLKELKEDNK